MQYYKVKKLENGFSYSPDQNGDIVLRKDLGDFNDENFRLKLEIEDLTKQVFLLKDEIKDKENSLMASRQSNANKIETIQNSYEDKIAKLKKDITDIESLRKEIHSLKNENEALKESEHLLLEKLKNIKNVIKSEDSKKKRKEKAATLLAAFKYLKTGTPSGDISSFIDDIFITSFSQNVSEGLLEECINDLEDLIFKD